MPDLRKIGLGTLLILLTAGCTTAPVPYRSLAGLPQSSFEARALSETTPDCVKILADPDKSFDMRKKMIRAAESEIILSYYELRSDRKPLQLLALLREAAGRGVKVRLLLDAFKTRFSKSSIRHLQDRGVEVRIFNPIELKNARRFDRRMHDKYTVVDGKFLLVGGRNLADAYFVADTTQRKTFYDLDAAFIGSPAREAQSHFNERWETNWVESKDLTSTTDDDVVLFSRQLDEAETQMTTDADSKLALSAIETQICAEVKFHAVHPDLSQMERNLEALYATEIQNAETSVEIVNPYVILTKPLKRAIRAAAKRGVKIRIVTNSMQSNDVFLTHSAYLNLRPNFIRWGVEVYEFVHAQTIHSKVAIFDRKKVIIGSFNLDPRSAKINSEDLVITEDQAAVLPVALFFDETVALSSRIGPDGKPEGFEHRHPGVSFRKRALNVLFRFSVAPLFRSRL